MLKTYPKSWIKINNKGGYFEDTNYKVEFTKNSIQITNLKNASKPNSECEVRTFKTKEDVGNWRNHLSLVGIPSFTKLIKTRKIEGFKLLETCVNSNDVYSPFVEVDEDPINEETTENVVETDIVVDEVSEVNEVEPTADTNEISNLPTKIGKYDVLEDSNIELTQTRCTYFKDINCCVIIGNNDIQIKELPKTKTTTEDCMIRHIYLNNFKFYDTKCLDNLDLDDLKDFYKTRKTDNSAKLIDELKNQNVNTFNDLFNSKNIKNLVFVNKTEKSNRIFSPFTQVKRISKRQNFSIDDIVNGIISGQIFYGFIEKEHYCREFHKNKKLDLFAFAYNILQIFYDDTEIAEVVDLGKVVKIKLGYLFVEVVLYYDKSCNLQQREDRLKELLKELYVYNQNLNSTEFSRLLTLGMLKPYVVYEIDYLKDENFVGEIEIGRKLVLSNDTNQYKVLKYTEYKLDDNKLYTISNYQNRLENYDAEDSRIIELDVYSKVATGFAIKEFFRENKTFPMIEESNKSSIQEVRNYVTNEFKLKFSCELENPSNIFHESYLKYKELFPNDIDYYKTMQKLDDEEEMLVDNYNMKLLESRDLTSYKTTSSLKNLTNIYN